MRRENLVPQSLSVRLFWLIAGVILLVEILVIMPGLGRERQSWLRERVMQARAVAMSVRAGAGTADPALRDTMLRLSGTAAIVLKDSSGTTALLPEKMPQELGPDIDLDRESLTAGMWRADLALLGREAPYARVHAACRPPFKGQIAVIVSQRGLARDLRLYAAHTAIFAVVLALATGGLVFLVLDRQLVRPMRVMTESIAGFRRNPGYAELAGLKWLSGRGDDEIAQAARELVAMQDELRAALWRNARLAALGTAVAKISHDLRNILTSALLVADRFHHHSDPMVRQAANTLIPAMERAVELVSRTVDFAQEGPPALTRSPVPLHALINEVADMLRTTQSNVVIDNLVPLGLVLSLDRNQIYRVLVNLLRNAVEAGATLITLTLEEEDGMPLLLIADNGPGLPQRAIFNLFRPFSGSGRAGGTGLGLAIARDLIRAHGGDLFLRRTGPEGTVFAMRLADEAARAAAN